MATSGQNRGGSEHVSRLLAGIALIILEFPMPSSAKDKRAVKIFVLYLLENINYPLPLCRISDVVMSSDYVLFLDFAESFNEMKDQGLIASVGTDENGDELYFVTERGRTVAAGLKSELHPSVMDGALAAAFRCLDFSKRDIRADCEIRVVNPVNGECDVTCRLTEKKAVILETTLRVDSRGRAERMRDRFLDRPETVFRGVTALLSGNVDYLFSGDKGS
ncbi:MAG: DUF4364 family protein [Clostridia bacterium]|nr:DUF4364 family protein [Clostridia bacterium]MBP5270809.1 DUF4364 family protein [Clostridia bacterium]